MPQFLEQERLSSNNSAEPGKPADFVWPVPRTLLCLRGQILDNFPTLGGFAAWLPMKALRLSSFSAA